MMGIVGMDGTVSPMEQFYPKVNELTTITAADRLKMKRTRVHQLINQGCRVCGDRRIVRRKGRYVKTEWGIGPGCKACLGTGRRLPARRDGHLWLIPETALTSDQLPDPAASGYTGQTRLAALKGEADGAADSADNGAISLTG